MTPPRAPASSLPDGATGGLALFLLLFAWTRVGILAFGDPTHALEFRPVPDAAEHAYVATALRLGLSPLLPIGNDLYPSRFPPFHALCLALFLEVDYPAADFLRWPALATPATISLLALLLLRAGVGWHLALAVGLLAGWAPITITLGASLQHEVTMGLAFVAALHLLPVRDQTSADVGPEPQTSARPRRLPRLLRLPALAVGWLAGAMFCMRPTLGMFLPVAIGLTMIGGGGGEDRLRRACWLLGGFVAAPLLLTAYNALHFERPDLFLYYVWIPDFAPFDVMQPLRPPVGEVTLTRPAAWLYAKDVLGVRSRALHAAPLAGVLWTGGVAAGMAVFAGCVRPVVRWARSAGGSAPPAPSVLFAGMSLLAAGWVLLQTFYFYYDPRFLFPAWLAGWGAAGLAGSRLIPRTSGGARRRAVELLAPLAALVLAAGTRPESPGGARAAAAMLAEVAPLAGYVDLPAVREERARLSEEILGAGTDVLFVDRLPVLNARLALRLVGAPLLIFNLRPVTELYWDGHVEQLNWGLPEPALARLVPRDQWRWPAHRSHLLAETAAPAAAGSTASCPGTNGPGHRRPIVQTLRGEWEVRWLRPAACSSRGGSSSGHGSSHWQFGRL